MIIRDIPGHPKAATCNAAHYRKIADQKAAATARAMKSLSARPSGDAITPGRGPMIIRDIQPHIGPSGRLISSRSEQRDEWKRTGTCAWEKLDDRPRGISDEKIAKARGEGPSEAAQDWLAKKKHALANGTMIKGGSLSRAQHEKVKRAQYEVLSKHRISS